MVYRSILAHENSSINSACVLGSTEYMITGGGNDAELKLHNISELNTSIEFPKIHTHPINAIDIAPNNQFFVSGSKGKMILYDIRKRQTVREFINETARTANFTSNNNNILDCKAISNEMIVSCGENHHLNFYDLKQSGTHPHLSINIGDDNLNSLDYDGHNLISMASSNGNVYHLDLRNQQLLCLEGSSPVVHLSYSEGKFIYRSVNGNIIIHKRVGKNYTDNLNVPTGNTIKHKINCFFKQNTLVNSIPAGKIQLWNIHFKNRRYRLTNDLEVNAGPNGKILQVYHDDNDHLIATSSDGHIHVWDELSQYLE